MARNTKTLGLVKGRRMRVTRLDGCGRPVYGDGGSVTSNGFTTVAYSANTNDVDEVRVQNANGETIVYEAGSTEFSGFGVEITLGSVDPELVSVMTGQDTVLDAFGNIVGLTVDSKVKMTDLGFALEVWAGAPTGDACDDEAAEGNFGYILIPFLSGGILGDFSVENGEISFTVTGANTKDGNAWGRGPYDVVLNAVGGDTASLVKGPLLQPLTTTTHLLLQSTQVAPPEAQVGTRPLLKRTDAPLASISATVAGNVATLTGTPDPEDGVGIWWEFGDGTWDYVIEDGGDVTHEYEPGTYTVSASTNGTWVTTTVTVPGS